MSGLQGLETGHAECVMGKKGEFLRYGWLYSSCLLPQLCSWTGGNRGGKVALILPSSFLFSLPSHLSMYDGKKSWRIRLGKRNGVEVGKLKCSLAQGLFTSFFFCFPVLVFSPFPKLGRIHYRKEQGKRGIGEFQ